MRGRAARDRAGQGLAADRHRRPPLHRRRLLALVQRPRPSPPGDRPGGPRPARPGGALDDARPHPPRGGGAGGEAGRDRPARAEPGLLLRLGLDRDRDRPEDGVPVPAAARRPAHATDLVRAPSRRLPRRHDRVGLGRRDRPLPRHLPAAAVRGPRRRARRRRRPRAHARRPRGRDRGGDRRAAGPGGGGDDRPPARLSAGGAGAVRPLRRAADLRRGGDRLRPHRDDVRLRAGGRRARPALRRQGADRRLPAARRDAGHGADLRGVPRRSRGPAHVLPRPHLHRQSRSPAPPRSPASRPSSASRPSPACSRRSASSAIS